jgi:cysteine desulfurase / selenocysteine lyase
MDWKLAQDAYPINARSIWLNNCGITPTGRHIATRMAEHFANMSERGPGGGDLGPERLLGAIRRKLGALIHARPDEIALVHNTAEGMTMVSWGLSLSAGDQILLLEQEYPSNVYPWQIWQSRGVALDFVALAQSPEAFLANFKDAVTERTKVVALSMVHWCTGMPLPLPEIAEICHQRGIQLVIDGSQGVGMVPLDFAALAPAVLCCSAWKWLLGPLGLGVLVMDRATLSRLSMPFKGTDSVADPSSYLPYQTEMRSSIDRYTYSTANYNDWVCLDASLEFLSGLGFERVHARILELTSVLWAELSAAGFESAYRHGAPESGILSVRKAGVDVDALCRSLGQRDIVTRVRAGHLRLAPHVYLSEEQMLAAARAMIELG